MGKKVNPWWRRKANLAFVAFLVIGGYFLIAEHRAHVIQWLPWVLISGCLGIHLFMHGGHGHRNGGGDGSSHHDNSK